jgi:hypothetical protein
MFIYYKYNKYLMVMKLHEFTAFRQLRNKFLQLPTYLKRIDVNPQFLVGKSFYIDIFKNNGIMNLWISVF